MNILHIHLIFSQRKDHLIIKTAAKVFIIIGMIVQCFMVFPVIIGAIVLSKLKKATCKSDFGIGWGIVTLLFVNVIAGIILLIMKDEDFL